MYLSKVTPTPGFVASQLARKAHAGDAYAQHQFLWLLFGDESERDFLFRYEQGKNGLCYYVLSRTSPGELEGVAVIRKSFSPRLTVGDELAYTLRANPTKMLKPQIEGGRGQRVDVLMHAKYQARHESVPAENVQELQLEAAQDWLLDHKRQELLGVSFLNPPEVTEHIQHQVYKRGTGNKNSAIRFTSVNYHGLLKIIEPERFLFQLGQGIGRSKAMGCGLMLVRRAD